MALILAGGFGAFLSYNLSDSASAPDVSAGNLASEFLPGNAVSAFSLRGPISFGTTQPTADKPKAKALASNESPTVTTATPLAKAPAATGSFLSRLNGSASRQDYVIRLTFSETTEVDLAVVANSFSAERGAIDGSSLAIAEPVAPTPALGLAQSEIATVAPAAINLAAEAEVKTSQLAEFQQANAVNPQGFNGSAELSADVLKFDLAAIPQGLPTRARNSEALVSKSGSASNAAASFAGKRDRVVGEFIFHQTAAMLNDNPAGQLDVRIGGDASLSIRVSALLAIVEGQMDPALFAAMSVSAGAAEYVSFGEIRAAGIDVRYDAAADRIVFTAD